MALRPMLLYGEFIHHDLIRVIETAADAGSELTRIDALDEAVSWLENNDAQVLLCQSGESEQLAVQTRSRAPLSKLPILALTHSLTDLDFVSVFSWGADDLVPLTPRRPLLTRLRALPKEPPIPPLETRGLALVAETEPTRRIAVARVLRNAGYSIRFAVTPQDAEEYSLDSSFSLVVANSELFPNGSKVIGQARAGGSRAKFIICAPPRQTRVLRAALEEHAEVTVTDGFSAPENVLFVANELMDGRGSGRSGVRLAYGAVVAFRGAGRDFDEWGYTYNVSERGLYVRTLAVPEDEEVWLELCPPRQERRVRLVGRVAWRRPFNYNESATVPPGFGVQIADGAERDRALWREGYAALAETLG